MGVLFLECSSEEGRLRGRHAETEALGAFLSAPEHSMHSKEEEGIGARGSISQETGEVCACMCVLGVQIVMIVS